MTQRYPILVLLLVAVAICTAAPALAATAEPASAPTFSLVAAAPDYVKAEPGVDPYYGLGDLDTEAVPVAFCLCQVGVNCCGDPGTHGRKCSINLSCRCNQNDDCLTP